MMSQMPPFHSEQSAGLSTAESDSMSGGSRIDVCPNSGGIDPNANGASVKKNGLKYNNYGDTSLPDPVVKVTVDEKSMMPEKHKPSRPSSTSPPPSKSRSKRGLFSKKSKKGKTSSKSPEGNVLSLSASLTNSAPTILIHTPSPSSSSDDPSVRPIRSAMSSRTLHESLHRGRASAAAARPKMLKRSVSFAKVNIREYERVLGDNPSVTSGPPLSIGWRYTPEPLVMKLDDYEEGKGLPRSSSEYLVPKIVREQLLREHAEVSRSEMVHAIRAIQKEKAQRRKTVVNLSMQPTEERIEGIKRKVKKILKPSKSYENVEAEMWDEAHAVAMEKARRLEESIRKGESVSSREYYRVGTPCNNILPSRRNSLTKKLMQNPEYKSSNLENGKVVANQRGDIDRTASTLDISESLESLSPSLPSYKPKPYKTKPAPEKTQSIGELDISRSGHHHLDQKAKPRASSTIVAEEEEDDDIFAKLVLDDVTQ